MHPSTHVAGQMQVIIFIKPLTSKNAPLSNHRNHTRSGMRAYRAFCGQARLSILVHRLCHCMYT